MYLVDLCEIVERCQGTVEILQTLIVNYVEMYNFVQKRCDLTLIFETSPFSYSSSYHFVHHCL